MGGKKEHASDEESEARTERSFDEDAIRRKLRSKIRSLQHETTRHITSEITETFSKLLNELDESSKIPASSSTPHDKSIRQKQFVPRESLLTELFEIKHIRSIYHAFIAALFISIIHSVLRDLLEDGVVRLGFRTIVAGFSGFHIVTYIWLGMFSGLMAIYLGVLVWREGRNKLVKSSQQYWDYVFLALLLLGYSLMFSIPAAFVGKAGLPIGSGFTIMMEQIRIIMKMHAFIRGCVPRYFLPSFSHYIYFLFAPTLIYRDSYPRTSHIRWNFVISRFLEVVGALFFVCFLGEQYLAPTYEDFGIRKTNWRSLMMAICGSMIPCTAFMTTGFYLLLHAWMNAWAELLRFADRTFYLDWWNATSYMEYYRTWNIVVHDFLYEYVYADTRRLFSSSLGNGIARTLGTFAVFVISATVHEYILGFVLGFFYPVLLVQFLSFGLLFAMLRLQRVGAIGNIFLWWSLTTGFGIQVSLYTMEASARINCPAVGNEGIAYYFIPRSLSCNGLN